MALGETGGDNAGPASNTNGGAGRSLANLIYDPKTRSWVFQIGLIVGVIAFFAWIILNTIHNLEKADKKSGFGFLGETGGFEILTTPGTWLLGFSSATTYWEIFLIGAVNTLAVSFIGIIAATLLGFLVGVFRLSSNAVLRGAATVYVEVLRNIPLLVQLFIWYKVVVELLPEKNPRRALTPEGAEPIKIFGSLSDSSGLLDKSGLWFAYPLPQPGFSFTLAAAALALIAWIVLSIWSKRRQEATGQTFPAFWVGLGLLIALPAIVFFISGQPLDWETPLRGGFGFRKGVGMVMKPEFFAVFLGLTLYTAAFIAEIVRAGILAVNKGQSEASYALGMRTGQTLNKVVIPQALRVIIPPLTSQYLNLLKNSSLAVAIAYPDVVSVFAGTALNQVGQEIEMILMMMLFYLFFSIVISIFMNWYNRSIALVER